jgi:hypothetical protein
MAMGNGEKWVISTAVQELNFVSCLKLSFSRSAYNISCHVSASSETEFIDNN